MEEKKPNPITRAIIDSTVDSGLREISEDPKRSIRKLTDMGRLFNKGRFMDEIYGMIQDLLRNDDSPYYTTIEQILRYTDRQNLKDFGISFGYSGLTFGGKIIRENAAKRSCRVPWSITFRINPADRRSMTVNELANCIDQGRALGIYVYIIRLFNSVSCLDALSQVIKSNPACAFMVLLPDVPLSRQQLASIKTDTNAMFLFPADTASIDGNLEAMRQQKSLYGVYATYGNADAADWYNGKKTKGLVRYAAGINLLVSDDACSIRNGQRVAKYCRSLRTHPEYPLILFDLVGDSAQISRIISGVSCFFELLENGDIRTENEIITDFRHTISLEQILEVALPVDPVS